MNHGIMSKLKNWVTGDPFEEDIYQVEEEEYDNRFYQKEPVAEPPRKKNTLKVVDHPNSAATQVVVIEPRAFEESLEIIEHLRSKKSVILNLHLLDTMQSQRVVDFLSGATHAIDGHQQRIGDGVFIFTPNNVSITSESDKGLGLTDAFWNTSR
jgi:cell division inhibitor SepF